MDIFQAIDKRSSGELGRIADELYHQKRINEKNPQGKTPLIYAIEKKFKQGVRIISLNHASIIEPDSDGNTPLHVAAKIDDGSMVSFLLQKGAKPDIYDSNG
ncbi:ankyrin repeat protein, putative, partial [Trichomonas vaginalis G3]